MRKISIFSVGVTALVVASLACATVAVSAEPLRAGWQPLIAPVGPDAPASKQHVTYTTNWADATIEDRTSIAADTLYSLGADSGFAAQTVDPYKGRIDLYWQGQLPDSIEAYIRSANSAGLDIQLTSLDAKFSRNQAVAAAERLSASASARDSGVVSISIDQRGQGLVLGVEGDQPDTSTVARLAAAADVEPSDLRFRVDAGVPTPLTGPRYSDSAPWKGGARIVAGSLACSSAFSALNGSAGRLLSAAHCNPNGYTVFSGGSVPIASAAYVYLHNDIDSMSMDPSASPATTPAIYVGSWTSSTTSTVKNWASNWIGDSVCSGGATTGSHCGTIIDDAVTFTGHVGSWYVRARATSGAFVGSGDSGGPVYRSTTGGVQARGVINAGYSTTITPCGSYNPDVAAPTCYGDFLYTPISVTLNSWGYALEVG